jgi:hypothetical protein
MIQSKILLAAGFWLLLAAPSLAAPLLQTAPAPAAPSASAPTTSETTDHSGARDTLKCKDREQTKAWQGWTEGGEYQRAKALNELRPLRRNGAVDRVQEVSDCLRRYYGLRAGRQQTALDAGSSVVFLGGLGSLASGGAGATTQTYWNYAALLPVVVAQFNANEPTRDLYAGARIGLDVIGGRYQRLTALTEMLAVSQTATTSADAIKGACDNLVTNGLDVERWDAGADKTAMLTDYRKLRDACVAGEAISLTVSDLSAIACGWKGKYGSAYARDLLRLDDEILSKDRQLRYSPVETLSAMAASPFAAVATLLSGDNGTQAINRLKTQQTFATLNVPLDPIFLPPNLAPITVIYEIGTDAEARRAASKTDEAALIAAKKPLPKTSATQVDSALRYMEEAAVALNNGRANLNYRLTLARAIVELAAYDQLVFSYDATNARVSVVLATTPPPVATSPAAAR